MKLAQWNDQSAGTTRPFGRHPARRSTGARWALGMAAALASVSVAQAAIVFDNYRGQHGVPTAPVGPSYVNYNPQDGIALDNFVAFTHDASGQVIPGNIASSGSGTDINWRRGAIADDQLCATWPPDRAASPACAQWLQGRVVYAILKFPSVGTYPIHLSHDDDFKMDVATVTPTTNPADYRSLPNYGQLFRVNSWTQDPNAEDNPEAIGSIQAPAANTCYAVRIHWNNRENASFLNLYWTPPGGARTIIPASALLDPTQAASYAGCATAAAAGPELTVTQTPSNPNAGNGDPVSIPVTVSNTGPGASDYSPVVNYDVPTGLTVNGLTPGAGWTCTPTTMPAVGPQTVSCTKTNGTIAAGAANEPVVTLDTTKTVAGQINTTATVAAGDPTCAATPQPARCAAPATIGAAPPAPPALAVHQTPDKPTAAVGDTVNYAVTIDNTGGPSSADPAVSFQVPAGLTVTGVTNGPGWTCTPTTGTGPTQIVCTKTGGTVAGGTTGEPVATITTTMTGTTPVNTTASVTAGDPACPGAPRCSAPATVNPTAVVGVPVNSPAMLVLLALLTLVSVAWRQRAKGRR